MPNYRRNRVPGATCFFMVNLRDRRSDLLVTQVDALREAARDVRRRSRAVPLRGDRSSGAPGVTPETLSSPLVVGFQLRPDPLTL